MSPHAAPEGVVTFSDGLPGFEACRRFVVVSSPDLRPFTVLQGVDDAGPSFVAIDPRAVEPTFDATLDRAHLARLSAGGQDTLLWLAIVSATEEGAATANLRAPVVINPGTMQGVQVITADSAYAVNHPLQVA